MKIAPIPPKVQAEPGKKVAFAVGHNFYKSMDGTPLLSIAFTVVHSKAQDVGALHVERFRITEKSIWRVAQFAGAVGYDKEFDPTVESEIEEVIATGPLVIELIERTYNGKTKMEIKSFNSWRGDVAKSWESITQGGEAQWAEIVKGIQARLTQGSSAGTTMNNVTTSTDDIPF